MGRAKGDVEIRPDVVKDFEEWLLIKMDAVRYTKEEAERMPVRRLHRFYGFEKAQKKLQEEEQEKQSRRKQYKKFAGHR